MGLTAERISFRYESEGPLILDQFSLKLQAGERVGLIAPSGFGKTTLCKILAGYETRYEGRVLVDGKPISSFQGRLPVQLIWQHPELSVNPRWRMGQVLKEGEPMDQDLPKRLGIRPEWMNRFPSELSGGELQRFCIARALGEGIRFLLADEVTSMLDLITQNEIWRMILEETDRRGIGLLLVSHSEPLMASVCHRVLDLSSYLSADKVCDQGHDKDTAKDASEDDTTEDDTTEDAARYGK